MLPLVSSDGLVHDFLHATKLTECSVAPSESESRIYPWSLFSLGAHPSRWVGSLAALSSRRVRRSCKALISDLTNDAVLLHRDL